MNDSTRSDDHTFLSDTRATNRRIGLVRAAAIADQAIATGRARRLDDGRFMPGSDLRARFDRLGVSGILGLDESGAREVDTWLARPIAE